MKRCPKCGASTFYVTAHVTQDWKVDEHGDFIECVDDKGNKMMYFTHLGNSG